VAEERNLPFVSVIIPVLDDLPGLTRCLAALMRQHYPADRFEVIAVDNGSSVDLRPALPSDPRFHLLRQDRPGSYAARNKGLAFANGEVLAFTDADCTPESGWLTAGVAALVGPPGADIVGGAVQLFFRSERPRGLAEVFEAREAFPQRGYVAHGWAVTGNMFTWRRSFDRVGSFDGTLRSRGDADWGQRLTRSGGVIRFAPRAVVLHPARADMRELLEKSRRTGRGKCDQQARQGGSRRNIIGLAAHQLRLALRKLLGGGWEPAPRNSGSRITYLAAYTIVRLAVTAEMVTYALRMPPGDYRSSRVNPGQRGPCSDHTNRG
jgi:glycosyltransferase involved in cell wall biosynthesis